jgi:hypothetical protein
MASPRIGLCCVVIRRLLYAIGGFDGMNRLNTVEVFNPDQNKWTFIEPMNTARSGAGSKKPYLVFALKNI